VQNCRTGRTPDSWKTLELHHGGLSNADVENPCSLHPVARSFSDFVNKDTANEPTVEDKFIALLKISHEESGI
jgi:hypothetical protein